MKKRVIIGIAIIIIVVSIGINALNSPPEQDENNTTVIEEEPSENQTTTTESEEPSEEVPATESYKIPSGPDRSNNLTRVGTVVGEMLTINPYSVLDIPAETYIHNWTQIFPNMTDTWYASHFTLNITENTNNTVTVSASEPGVYRLKVSTSNNQEYLLEVMVTKQFPYKWDVKGVIFGDVWGELGAPEFNIAPKDPERSETVLNHAMEGPARIGANYVGVVPARFYQQVLPTPVFRDEGNFLSLTNETYYSDLVQAAHSMDLMFLHTEQLAEHWDLTSEDREALETIWEDSEWAASWFEEWKEYVIPRAEMAERHNVEIFVLYLFPDVDSFKAENYVEGWKDIIAEVREVYSGDIAFNVINADERLLPLVDDLDAVLITIFPGLYMSRLEDTYNPTVEEVTEMTKGMLNAPNETIAGKISVYYVLTIQSADGQTASEDPAWKTSEEGVDFNEQVIYYEGVFKALENETWVNGFFTERWDYFDQYRREGDSYEAAYFDFTREASPRSKPAEDLIKLWYDLH